MRFAHGVVHIRVAREYVEAPWKELQSFSKAADFSALCRLVGSMDGTAAVVSCASDEPPGGPRPSWGGVAPTVSGNLVGVVAADTAREVLLEMLLDRSRLSAAIARPIAGVSQTVR